MTSLCYGMMSFACFNNFQTGMEVKSIRLKTNWNIVDPADRGTVLWAAIVIGWDLSLVRAWNLMVRHLRLWKIPWRRERQCTPVFYSWRIPWTRSLVSYYSSWGLKESNTTEQLSIHKAQISRQDLIYVFFL